MSKVYLIGGGPGAPDLITLRAINALRKCTAILYDRLSGTEILKYVNPEAEVYYCGKEPGCHYKTQEEINNSLVELAKKGHMVGRIKGGDPYIFGRGGEEALALLKEDIPFEVIPGITSPIAALNFGGIPVTHRGIAQSFHVFTGKSAAGLNLDFDTIAKLKGTLLFMMSFEQLGNICTGLIKAGKSEDTAVGIVMNGTTAKQRKAVGTLSNIEERATTAGISNPCIIAVGDVVKFHDELNWFEKLPLFGRNICVTRSKEQSKELIDRLTSLGAAATEINSIAIEENLTALEAVKNKLPGYKYIIITSVNGVNTFFKALKAYKIDIRSIKGDFISIGEATTKAMEEHGIIPTVEGDKFTGEGLFEAIKDKICEGDDILIPRSKKGRAYLVKALEDIGGRVDDIPIYDTVVGKNLNVASFKDCDTVLFTSPSTVKNMIDLVGLKEISTKKIISIGPITSKELKAHNLTFEECEEQGVEGIINKLMK